MTTSVQTNTVSSSLLAAVNGSSSTSSSSSNPDSTQAIQDRFMTLLVTQMQNQDPLNPMDTSQMTSQLAQLSTVSGIDKLNTTLQALSDSYQSSQSIEAASMIGKGVLVPGSTLDLQNGNAVFGMDLAQGADSVKVSILDSSGRTVRSIDLGKQDAGTLAFAWDGTNDAGAAAASGSYTFKVNATSGDTAVTADALSYGQVGSVTRNTQGVKLNIPNLGEVDLSNVKQIL